MLPKGEYPSDSLETRRAAPPLAGMDMLCSAWKGDIVWICSIFSFRLCWFFSCSAKACNRNFEMSTGLKRGRLILRSSASLLSRCGSHVEGGITSCAVFEARW